MSGKKITFHDEYDISPKEREILEYKAARRNMLRQEFLKKTQHPFRYFNGEATPFVDTGIQRAMVIRVAGENIFTPTLKNGILSFLTLAVPTGLLIYFVKHDRESRERKIRTGQVSYADRNNKFY